jgi:hypothetical protein
MKRSFSVVTRSMSQIARNEMVSLERPLKIQKMMEIEWISATKLRNYMLNDPLTDWLKLYDGKKEGSRLISKSHTNNTFHNQPNDNFKMEKGNIFEEGIISVIKKTVPIVSISNVITDESCEETIQHIKNGTPVIHSAPVRNKKNHTSGIIDLLVRSDYLSKIVNDYPEQERISTDENYHYVVIDIKFSTLPLRADGTHLLNSKDYRAYKSQLWVYNEALGIIQGFTPNKAYLLGRRWKYTSKGIEYRNCSSLDKLGTVDFSTVDKEIVQESKDAIEWCKEVRDFGHTWSINPPSREELYPNMCVDAGSFQKRKEEIAFNLGEISLVWNCGVKHRKIAFKNGIKSWRDKKCTSKNIGINGTRASTIDKIIEINRGEAKINIGKIKNNIHGWKEDKVQLVETLPETVIYKPEMFVDFETLNDMFTDFSELPLQKSTDMIFMIGVWYHNAKTDKWEYKHFRCETLTPDEEFRIMNEFNNFVLENGGEKTKLWYWCAEDKFWKRYEKRQYDRLISQEDKTRLISKWKLNWVDMYDIFTHKDEAIAIKGSFNFALKNIAKALRNHGFISSQIESNCCSGMDAMIIAYNAYSKNEEEKKKELDDVAKYNEFDCKVLHEILSYLRKYHS